ncbi:MAG TPA: 6-carboxytetrahydropterin synthase [Sedimentisphaerales bacterium]|nr:6-carboxytetrahydropterin synthase [Sedimentisphaerales bacterium]
MFTIAVESSFNASHQLTLPDGSKENLHNHNWQITVEVSKKNLNKLGLVMDFNLLKSKVDNITAGISDIPLEKNSVFSNKNASAENVAFYIYEMLAAVLPEDVTLEAVKVVEEPGCFAVYRK